MSVYIRLRYFPVNKFSLHTKMASLLKSNDKMYLSQVSVPKAFFVLHTSTTTETQTVVSTENQYRAPYTMLVRMEILAQCPKLTVPFWIISITGFTSLQSSQVLCFQSLNNCFLIHFKLIVSSEEHIPQTTYCIVI